MRTSQLNVVSSKIFVEVHFLIAQLRIKNNTKKYLPQITLMISKKIYATLNIKIFRFFNFIINYKLTKQMEMK